MSDEQIWEMKFDLNTLEHLGVKLYTQYPPMIAELISNSWDADANNVKIHLFDKEDKKIVVQDDGHSMNADELNSCFLTVGRNRRIQNESGKSRGGRCVLGKKGIGKLSMFGIAEEITVTTTQDGVRNSFSMDYSKMKRSGGVYKPMPLIVRQKVSDPDGTIIELSKITRKSAFDPASLVKSLSKRFSIFDLLKVDIFHNENYFSSVANKDLFDGISHQFSWKFPEDFQGLISDLSYYKDRQIHGELFTAATPLKKFNQGVTLLARGKLVQENAYFDDRSNDYFHSYLYGYLNIDFIDEDNELDHVSTDRKSLVWEGDELEGLQQKLNEVLKAISKDWRTKRAETKKKDFHDAHGVNVDEWVSTLNAAERPLAQSIATSILGNNSLEDDKAAALLQHVQDVFSLQGFKDFAETLKTAGALDEGSAIKLLQDWQFIEAKEMAKLADGRISTIDQFEVYINKNASETKVMQKFLEEFPWILDPRMSSFEREVTYSRWLKDHFPDDALDEPNRRIDFLCTNGNGIAHIIELKRPNIRIGMDEINQCSQYIEFIKKKQPDTIKEVRVVLISENHDYGPGVETLVNALRRTGEFEVKSYSDLLTQARSYHKDFIVRYEELLLLRDKSRTKS